MAKPPDRRRLSRSVFLNLRVLVTPDESRGHPPTGAPSLPDVATTSVVRGFYAGLNGDLSALATVNTNADCLWTLSRHIVDLVSLLVETNGITLVKYPIRT